MKTPGKPCANCGTEESADFLTLDDQQSNECKPLIRLCVACAITISLMIRSWLESEPEVLAQEEARTGRRFVMDPL